MAGRDWEMKEQHILGVMISVKWYLISFMNMEDIPIWTCTHGESICHILPELDLFHKLLTRSKQKKYQKVCSQCAARCWDSLLAVVPTEWCVDLSAAVHDSGMIKDLYRILILPLCCQQLFPVPHTQVCKLMQLCTTWQWERKMGSRSPVTEKQNASFPFVWNGAMAQSKPCSWDGSFRVQWKGCYMISDYS